MAKFGYIRVSSKDQNIDRQKELLKNSKIDKFYIEKQSGATINERPILKELLETIHFDDVVVITELDRLSRSSEDLTKIIGIIQDKKASLEVLNLPTTQTNDPNLNKLINNLILEIYKYISENERLKIKERQRQGIELAKKRGVYTGRKKKYRKGNEQLEQAFKLYDEGESIRSSARKTGINYETLRRYLKDRNI